MSLASKIALEGIMQLGILQQKPTFIGANQTVTTRDIKKVGRFVLTAGGLTVTIPAPSHALRDQYAEFLNTSTSTSTVSCTGGFPNSGNSVTIPASGAVRLHCLENGSGGFLWWAEATSSAITSHESSHIRGGGDAVDGDQLEITWTAVGYVPVIDALAGDLTDLTAHLKGIGAKLPLDPAAFVPTPNWAASAPASVTLVARQHSIGPHLVHAVIDVRSADGGGAILNSITFPAGLIPANIGATIPVKCNHIQDASGTPVETTRTAHIVADDATAGNRRLVVVNPVTCTATQGFVTSFSMDYEV